MGSVTLLEAYMPYVPRETLWSSSLALLAILIFAVIKKIYNHVNHPLYRFPGPPVAAWTNALHAWMFLSGRQPYHMLTLHEKYGPVVRTAPNELSFSSPGSWRDIYGSRPGHRTFVKGDFYDGVKFADQVPGIVGVQDPARHAMMRKYLSHAFSDRSLKATEYLVQEMIDLFIDRIGMHGAKEGGINIEMWFNLLTFDIIGSLAFGEPFGGLESAQVHPWIDLVTNAFRHAALVDSFNRFPYVATVFKALMPGAINKLIQDTRTHEAYTMKLVHKRINTTTNRPDFLTRIFENEDQDKISEIQIAAHASEFVIAGSDTSATVLSSTTYYLLRNPEVYRILQEEVRSAFNSYGEINVKSTSPLKYLEAVCLEGMRIYSPVPLPLPRTVPEGGDSVDGYQLPAGTVVSTNPVAANLSTANFESPFEFRPERWLNPNGKEHLDAMQPFSLGSRVCLGRTLAWMELRIAIAKLHWKYDLKLLNEDLDWHGESRMHTLWQKPELMVSVSPRIGV